MYKNTFHFIPVIPVSEYISSFSKQRQYIETLNTGGNHTKITCKYCSISCSVAFEMPCKMIISYCCDISVSTSASLFSSFDQWRQLRANHGLEAPTYVIPHAIANMMPQAKIIITLRDPVHRLACNYLLFINKFVLLL